MQPVIVWMLENWVSEDDQAASYLFHKYIQTTLDNIGYEGKTMD